MSLHLLSIIRYNFRFVSKKVIFFLGWITAILIFHTLYNKGYTDYSAMDVFLVSIGMVEFRNLHIIQIFIQLIPYFGIAIIVDVYIVQMMGKHAIYSILRIEKRFLFIVSHVLSLSFIIFAMLFSYYIMLLITSFTLYDHTMPLSEALFSWIAIPQEDMVVRLLLPAFIGQFIGTFCMSCVQLAISIKFNRMSSGFIFVVILYFLQLVFPLMLGQHVFVANILMGRVTYLSFLMVQLLLIAIAVCYLYVASKKNMLMFSERG